MPQMTFILSTTLQPANSLSSFKAMAKRRWFRSDQFCTFLKEPQTPSVRSPRFLRMSRSSRIRVQFLTPCHRFTPLPSRLFARSDLFPGMTIAVLVPAVEVHAPTHR
jgi:hypothetical protein